MGTRRAQFILNAANLDDTAAEVVAHGGRLYRYSPESGKLFQDLLQANRVPLLVRSLSAGVERSSEVRLVDTTKHGDL